LGKSFTPYFLNLGNFHMNSNAPKSFLHPPITETRGLQFNPTVLTQTGHEWIWILPT
jgi:hypothetical protein